MTWTSEMLGTELQGGFLHWYTTTCCSTAAEIQRRGVQALQQSREAYPDGFTYGHDLTIRSNSLLVFFLILCTHRAGEGASHSACVDIRGCRKESVLLLSCGAWRSSQVTRLGGRHFYPLSHLTGPLDYWHSQHRRSFKMIVLNERKWSTYCVFCMSHYKKGWYADHWLAHVPILTLVLTCTSVSLNSEVIWQIPARLQINDLPLQLCEWPCSLTFLSNMFICTERFRWDLLPRKSSRIQQNHTCEGLSTSPSWGFYCCEETPWPW